MTVVIFHPKAPAIFYSRVAYIYTYDRAQNILNFENLRYFAYKKLKLNIRKFNFKN